jgi:hypothetical protein
MFMPMNRVFRAIACHCRMGSCTAVNTVQQTPEDNVELIKIQLTIPLVTCKVKLRLNGERFEAGPGKKPFFAGSFGYCHM